MIRNIMRFFRRSFWRLRLRLPNSHPTFLAGGYSSIHSDFTAGPFSYVGPGCEIGPGVAVGAYTIIGPGVRVIGNDHVFSTPGVPVIFSGRPPFKPTSIGSDVWIGAASIIISGVSIGDGAIVAAGSVVTKAVAPFTVVAGVPARVLRRRFRSLEEERTHSRFLAQRPIGRPYPKRLGD